MRDELKFGLLFLLLGALAASGCTTDGKTGENPVAGPTGVSAYADDNSGVEANRQGDPRAYTVRSTYHKGYVDTPDQSVALAAVAEFLKNSEAGEDVTIHIRGIR